MRSASTILFTFLYLFSYTELHEVFSIPFLISHYQEHREDNANQDLATFLISHYWGGNHEEKHKHSQLPFSDDRCVHSTLSSPVNIPDVFVAHFNTPIETEQSRVVYHPNLRPALLLFTIWQPPRNV